MKPKTRLFLMLFSWSFFLFVTFIFCSLYNDMTEKVAKAQRTIDKYIHDQAEAITHEAVIGWHIWRIDFPDGGQLLVLWSDVEIQIYPVGGAKAEQIQEEVGR